MPAKTVAVLAFAFALAGCAAHAPKADAPTTTTTHSDAPAPEPAFSVPAPEFHTGNTWLMSVRIAGQESFGGDTTWIDDAFTTGTSLVADGYTAGGKPAFIARFLYADFTTSTPEAMEVAGARVVTPDLTERHVDTQFLRSCQVRAATCPTELGPFLEPAPPFLSFHFPLVAGNAWSDEVEVQSTHGTTRSRVAGMETVNVLGHDVEAVGLDVSSDLAFDDDFAGAHVHEETNLTGHVSYAPSLAVLAVQDLRVHSTADLSGGLFSGHGTQDVTLHLEVVLADLTTAPGRDAVDLYDALGLEGRHLTVTAARTAPDAFHVALHGDEVPLEDVSWRVRDSGGHEVQKGTGVAFDLKLAPGTYHILAEARHHGKVLARADEPVRVEVHYAGTVTCTTVAVDVAGVGAHGECPKFPFTLASGIHFLAVTANATNSLPSGTAGILEVLDPTGKVAASATTGAAGNVTLEVPGDARGTWNARFRPEAGLQMQVAFSVTGE